MQLSPLRQINSGLTIDDQYLLSILIKFDTKCGQEGGMVIDIFKKGSGLQSELKSSNATKCLITLWR